MHELALTEGIISIVESEKKKHGFERVSEISLKLGEYSGVIPECMEEFFPIASKGTAAAGAKLRFEKVPAQFTTAVTPKSSRRHARSAAEKTSK